MHVMYCCSISEIGSFLCMIQVGKLSTGDSLDMSPHDEAAIVANDATVKDMEVAFYSLSLS